ncbi:MAG: thiamine phosphate synthase [Gammaproteobacteria bacterium]|nr:thiamine phosphate synthase [Gammaproteobacteria bacterium]
MQRIRNKSKPALATLNLPGLYLITPDGWSCGRLQARLKPMLRSGIAMLQYRDKRATAGQRLATAQMLASLCRAYQTPLIINDDVTLARQVQAAGVHLGRDDNDPRLAREQLGADAIIGSSCYNDLALAARMRSAGADYLAFGSVFASATKPTAQRCGLEILQQARSLGLPLVAIGGIRLDNAAQTLHAGADMLAVISDVFDAADPGRRVQGYQRLFAQPSA